jgi:hypothetical protein
MSEQIEACEGWRLLGPDDVLRHGDEMLFYVDRKPYWMDEPDACFNQPVAKHFTYRRRIPAKPEPLELKDSNGELDANAGPKDCSLMQDGRGELPEVIVLSGIDDIRKLGEWFISVADWREAQDGGNPNER